MLRRTISFLTASSYTSEKAFASYLRHLLDAGRINAFCSQLRDHHHQHQPQSAGTAQQQQQHYFSATNTADAAALFESQHPQQLTAAATATATATATPSRSSDHMNSVLRRSISDALYRAREPVSFASWTVLANIAVSQGMWARSLQVFDKLVEGTEHTRGRKPSPHAVAQTLRPRNIDIVREWCRRNDAKFDIVTGMRALVEYSDDWAAALRLAIDEEKKSAPLGASDAFSLGALIPFLANGGHWVTAAAVLGDALAHGSLVTDSLVRMIIRSTAQQQRTWVSCLALTSSLSKCFAIQADTPTAQAELQSTLRSVAAVCPRWQQACALMSVYRRAGVSPDAFVIGSAMEKCQAAGRRKEASALMRCAIDEGVTETEDAAKRLVETFRAECQWVEAIRALAWMSGADSAGAAAGLLTTIELCATAGQWRAAAEIGARVLAPVGSPDAVAVPCRPASSYVALIDVLGTAGRWREAAQAFAEMAQDSTVRATSARALETVLRTCTACSAWDAALDFFGNALQWEPRVLLPAGSYETVVRACLAAARWKEAVEVLRIQNRNGVHLEPLHLRAGMWASALTSHQHQRQQQSSPLQRTSSAAWLTCLRFYNHIPITQRTTGDTEVVARMAKAVQSQAAQQAIRDALLSIALAPGDRIHVRRRHHHQPQQQQQHHHHHEQSGQQKHRQHQSDEQQQQQQQHQSRRVKQRR